jgi:competence protein ComQ
LAIPQALTLSNALLMESFDLFLDYLPKDRLPIFHKIIMELKTASIGMWRDLSFTVSEPMPSEADYFALVEKKSVPLIRMIFELNDARRSSYSLWEKAAKYIGYAGQLENDAKDILRDTKSDLLHKKATLPLIKAIEFSKEKDQGWLLGQIDQLDASQNDKKRLMNIREYIKRTGAIDYCLILSNVYLNKSIQLLRDSDVQRAETLIKFLEG